MASFPDEIPLKVDHDSPLPLYSQLREALLALLKSGEYREGDSFPTERELEQRFEVSRITVRRALDELVREGYLIAQQGRGTFVAKPACTPNEKLFPGDGRAGAATRFSPVISGASASWTADCHCAFAAVGQLGVGGGASATGG